MTRPGPQLYAADNYKPKLFPGRMWFYCILECGFGPVVFLFASRYERDERIRRRVKVGYSLVGRGRVKFKEQPR